MPWMNIAILVIVSINLIIGIGIGTFLIKLGDQYKEITGQLEEINILILRNRQNSQNS